MPRRSRLEIYLQILQAIAAGARKPTHIMYRVNLAWKPASDFLATLREKGLIREEPTPGGREYRVTEKGSQVLDYFLKANQMLHTEPQKTYV
jgi:predicted transcriptional regulator